MTTVRAFLSKLGHFFLILEKGQGRSPTPLPPLITPLLTTSVTYMNVLWEYFIIIVKVQFEITTREKPLLY